MNSTAGSRTRRRAGHALAVALVFLASAAFAQGITDTQVTIGQTVALSGSVGEHGKALTLGAQAYFDKVNRARGVHGRKLALVTLDDAGDSKRAQENARKLILEQKVVALFSGAEGGPCVAATALAGELRVPVVGCAGGSPELREPFNPFSFPIRAAHLDEFEKLVEYAALFGRKRIGFVHSDSETGRKHLANVRRVADRYGAVVALAVSLPSGKEAFDPTKIAGEIAKADVEALLNHGSYGQYAEIIRAVKKQGSRTQFLAVNSGAQQMVRLLGGDASGLIFAQVVPFPWFEATPIVREYRDALKSHAPQAEPSFSSLEGFINAKVLVEALRRTGRKPTRKGLIAALELMRRYDVGGLTVSYAAGSHQGSRFVDVVVVGANGEFVR
jgi:ABC-type branched-subunit amino acid transport system substrate-binding protein